MKNQVQTQKKKDLAMKQKLEAKGINCTAVYTKIDNVVFPPQWKLSNMTYELYDHDTDSTMLFSELFVDFGNLNSKGIKQAIEVAQLLYTTNKQISSSKYD